MSFEDKFKILNRVLGSQSLDILVWGSGTGASKDYEKRLKIQNAIKTDFPNADVRFSEDPELARALSGSEYLTVPEQELWHLAACDMCIVLDTSAGPSAEIARFGNSTYAYKLLVFTHEKHKGASSFPAELRKYLNQIFYSDAEYDACDLVARIVERVRLLALGQVAGRQV